VAEKPGKTALESSVSGGDIMRKSEATNITSAVGVEETAGRSRARRSSLFTQTLLWITGLVCLALLAGSVTQAWTNYQLNQSLQQLQQLTQQMQQDHDKLQQQVGYYQDPAVIESEARQQMGYAQPGDHVVVVVPGSYKQQGQSPAQPMGNSSLGFWQAWWDFFFGNH
jgi:cell division protein FtsL